MKDHSEKNTAPGAGSRRSALLRIGDLTLSVTGARQIRVSDFDRGSHALCAFPADICAIEDIGSGLVIVTLDSGEQKLLNIRSVCRNGRSVPPDLEAALQPYLSEYFAISPENIRWFAETFGLSIFSRLKSRYVPAWVDLILRDTSHELVDYLTGLGIRPDTLSLVMLADRELLTFRDLDEAKRRLLKLGGIYQAAYLIENADHLILPGLWYKEDFSEADLKDYKGPGSVNTALLYAIRMGRQISCRYGSVCLRLDPVRLMDDTEDSFLLAFDETGSVFSSYRLSGLKDVRILDGEARAPAPSGVKYIIGDGL